VFVAVPALVLGWRDLRFSNLSYTLLFAFFALHELGAHYAYSEVYVRPLDAGAVRHVAVRRARLRAQPLRPARAFLYGLLIAPAAVELFDAKAPVRAIWRWLLPILFMLSHSVIYETIEWLAAEVFAGDLGQAYPGTQGDEWDAQKDMALAALGATLAVAALRLRGTRSRGAAP
jgi:putative membrane protein